jgi:hypothetical protein
MYYVAAAAFFDQLPSLFPLSQSNKNIFPTFPSTTEKEGCVPTIFFLSLMSLR